MGVKPAPPPVPPPRRKKLSAPDKVDPWFLPKENNMGIKPQPITPKPLAGQQLPPPRQPRPKEKDEYIVLNSSHRDCSCCKSPGLMLKYKNKYICIYCDNEEE